MESERARRLEKALLRAIGRGEYAFGQDIQVWELALDQDASPSDARECVDHLEAIKLLTRWPGRSSPTVTWVPAVSDCHLRELATLMTETLRIRRGQTRVDAFSHEAGAPTLYVDLYGLPADIRVFIELAGFILRDLPPHALADLLAPVVAFSTARATAAHGVDFAAPVAERRRHVARAVAIHQSVVVDGAVSIEVFGHALELFCDACRLEPVAHETVRRSGLAFQGGGA